MPSRMIHYLVAERVAKEIPIRDRNRFKIGSLCPDMSTREDESKHKTHYSDIVGAVKGMNWGRFVNTYGEKMKTDELYLGVLCHLITDGIWFHNVVEPQVRAKVASKEERQKMYQRGYSDYHRLNYILKEEFDLRYELREDRDIELDGLHSEFYDDVIGALYGDFYEEPPATKEELTVFPYGLTVDCIECCVAECVDAIRAFYGGKEIVSPEKYYVPVRDTKETTEWKRVAK
ncbi:MAG: zinc dependent phospholipase C family protein [Lachnospiraceae bacterium]|nr:zinc dependent phospholipase C family protein [Lachnospiraceae bacterium]